MDDSTKKSFSILPPFLTVEETARLARVSEVSVRRWLASGVLRTTKFGGVTRIAREDLEAFTATSGSGCCWGEHGAGGRK